MLGSYNKYLKDLIKKFEIELFYIYMNSNNNFKYHIIYDCSK